MNFDEVVKRRKMIREYDSDREQIPDQIITKLIKNAHKTLVRAILRFRNL
jgi:hypothetical protein